jgi:hypothetical protein
MVKLNQLSKGPKGKIKLAKIVPTIKSLFNYN